MTPFGGYFQSFSDINISTVNINSIYKNNRCKMRKDGETGNIWDNDLFFVSDIRVNKERMLELEQKFGKDNNNNQRIFSTICDEEKYPRHGAGIILPMNLATNVIAVITDKDKIEKGESPRIIILVIRTNI